MRPVNISILQVVTLAVAVVAAAMAVHLVDESRALSYLSSDPVECTNCHVMEAYYASWANSSHANRATCVDCHLPTTDVVDKYLSKARDGWNHSLAFTLDTYGKRMLISDDGARRVQENCIRCHGAHSTTLAKGIDAYYDFGSESLGERRCWDCHRLVPHDKVRSINASPHNLALESIRSSRSPE